MGKNLWVLKTVNDTDKASQTIDSYNDILTERYNYDNFVANSKQIKKGDQAILIDKKQILGFTTIKDIIITKGQKTIRRCPECPSTTIDKRKIKKPIYRCNKGHEFETAVIDIKNVNKYSASFVQFISVDLHQNDLEQLRPYYTNGYNQNMSMQLLSIEAFDLFEGLKEELDGLEKQKTSSASSFVNESENTYNANSIDERETIYKAIKTRRGQHTFRKYLLDIYDSTCIISGCKVVDILEAAHINPYRGEKDHHSNNGLLLRADLHTLFDLDLIKINPENYLVEISDKLIGSEYEQYDALPLEQYKDILSEDALKSKYDVKR